MEELSYVFSQYFVSCVHFPFYFSPPLIFTLLAGAFLVFSPPLCFSPYEIRSLFFSITRSSSFSVIHVSVNMKNNAVRPCDFLPNKTWVAFGLPYLLIELFYIGMPVVRTEGRSSGRAGGRSVYSHVITKFSRMGRLPHFLSYGTLLAARGAPL